MTSLIAKTATVALYALAALPFIAVSFARAETATVKVSDLNLSQPAQVQQLNRRVEKAADQVCGTSADLSRTAPCRAAVRTEVAEQLKQRKTDDSMAVASRWTTPSR